MATLNIDTKAYENVLSSDKKKLLNIMAGENKLKGVFRNVPFSYVSANFFGSDGILGSGANGLLRVPHTDYYLEVYFNNSLLTSIAFPYNPSSYSINRPENVMLTHTTGRVFRETALNRVRNINFQGFSGFDTRLGYARDGGYIYENGEVIMHEFEEFLNAYNYLCSFFSGNKYSYSMKAMEELKNHSGGGYGNLGNQLMPYGVSVEGQERLFLVLRCVNENISFKVEVDNFSYSKEIKASRFGYLYNISFKSYGLYGPGRRSNILIDFVDRITGYINKANVILSLVEAAALNLSEDYITPLRKPIAAAKKVLDNFQKAIESIGIVTGAVADLANDSIDLIQKIFDEIFSANVPLITDPIGNLGGTIKSQYKSVVDNVTTDDKNRNAKRENAKKNNADVDIDIGTVESQLGLDTAKNSTVLEKRNIDVVLGMLKNVDYQQLNEDKIVSAGLLQSLINSLKYQAETIKSIIPRNYVSIGKRYNDKSINFSGLPQFDLDEQDNRLYKFYRLKEGEDLRDVSRRISGNAEDYLELVEVNGWMDARRKGDGSFATAGDKIKILSNFKEFAFTDDVYYADLNAPLDDLIIDNNDVSLVRGISNFKQSLKNIFLTYEEELSNFVNSYGLANIIGARNLEVVKQEIKNKLIADTRVKNVNVKEITTKDDQLVLSLTIVGIDNQIIELNAPTVNNS
jgi:hypothetical protein